MNGLKKWFWYLIFALMAEPVIGITIHEILYDPTSESGGEAVLLYNQDNVSRDISGWTIATEASSSDATLPPGSLILAKGTYLIADAGWENTKNLSWPSADHEEPISMYNTNSGIALKDENGVIVDAVGWGLADFYEGIPHAGTPEGMSLLRTQDTDDNSADFIVAEPAFVVANGEEVPFILDINATGVLVITNISLSSTSLTPIAGIGATLDIIVITSESAYVVALVADKVVDLQELSPNKHKATVTLPYHLHPDNYSITVTASNGTDTVSSESSIEYLPLAAIGLDITSLDIRKLAPGRTTLIEGDSDPTTDKPTIMNLGNVPVDIVLSARAPSYGASKFSLSKIKYSLDGSFNSTLSGTFKTRVQTEKVQLAPNSTLPLSFQITVPSTYQEGTYEGSITIGTINPSYS